MLKRMYKFEQSEMCAGWQDRLYDWLSGVIMMEQGLGRNDRFHSVTGCPE